MEDGSVVSAGSSRSRAASTESRSSSKNAGSFIAPANQRSGSWRGVSRLALPPRIEGLSRQLAISLFEEDFHTAFRLFQLLMAFARQRHSFFEEFHRVVQRELRALQASDNFLEARKGPLEVGLL